MIDNDFFKTDRKFEEIMKNMHFPIFIVGFDGKFKYFNDSTKKIIGDSEFGLNSHIMQNIHPDDRDRLLELFKEGVKKGKSFIDENIKFRIVNAKGESKWYSSMTKTYIDIDGNSVGFISMLKDIDREKQMEIQYEKIKRDMQKFKQEESIKSMDAEEKITLINKSLEGICLLFNLSFSSTDLMFWMGIDNLSKLFKTFVNIMLNSEELDEFKDIIMKKDLDIKIRDGQAYLKLID